MATSTSMAKQLPTTSIPFLAWYCLPGCAVSRDLFCCRSVCFIASTLCFRHPNWRYFHQKISQTGAHPHCRDDVPPCGRSNCRHKAVRSIEQGLQTDGYARHFLRSNRRFFNRKENVQSLLLEYVENSF